MCDENISPKQFPFWKQYLVKHKKDQIGMDRIMVEKSVRNGADVNTVHTL